MATGEPTLVCSVGDTSDCGIQKRVLHAGKGDLSSFEDGTKVTFHYMTRLCDEDKTVLDDSRKDHGETMELIIGKKFKLEVWETCLKTMRSQEVACFKVHKSLALSYPPVAKSLRDIRHGKSASHQHHCCGMSLQDQGLGYDDLNKLMKHPEDIEFVLDVQKIEAPGDFQKENWCMDEAEKLDKIPQLQDEGNRYYMNKDPAAAADKYMEALGLLEQLVLREKPGDEDWKALDQRKVPLLLNLAQCQLLQKDYYPAIEHATEVLNRDPGNVKALFRRAKAHAGAWNPDDAIEDFKHVLELDSSLEKTCNKEIQAIIIMKKKKDAEDRAKLEGKIFT